MSIVATTLSGAIGANDVSFGVASATGITAPNFQTGSGITILQVESERMLVSSLAGTVVGVVRGWQGTIAASHAASAGVLAGNPSDFGVYQEVFQDLAAGKIIGGNFRRTPIFLTGSADAVDSTKAGYYVIKTAGVDAITLAIPTAAEEGNVIDIWSDTDQAHTITGTTTYFACASASGLRTVCTFPAKRGAGVTLRAQNLVWVCVASGGTGTNSGPVVWT